MLTNPDLLELLMLEIPAATKNRETFLSIANNHYKENTISRLYAYFLSKDKNESIATLFLQALIDLIPHTSKEDQFLIDNVDYFVEVEVPSKKGRIDLLVMIEEELENKEKSKTAIIIENKIFHQVNNDLEDYWNSVDANKKFGVLLTLKPHEIEETLQPRFINITHIQWVTAIKRRGLPAGLSMNEYVYLNDFITNMENLTTQTTMTDDAEFFFKYPSKVLRAKQTLDAAHEYIITQLRIVAQKAGKDLYGASWSWRHIWKQGDLVYYVFEIDKVFTATPELTIYLEVYKEALRYEKNLRSLLTEAGTYAILNDDGKSTSSWAHLAMKTYSLEPSNLKTFTFFVEDKLTTDFKRAFKLVEDFLRNGIPTKDETSIA
jgi:hypothetical protein